MTDQQQQTPPAAGGNPDVDNNKALAIVGYIFPILFFLPLVIESSKNSPFAKFHANQQLVLLITAFIVQFTGVIIPFLGWFVIFPLGMLFVLVCIIMGVINAAGGQMKKLPLIGGFAILK
jgi:uncharacterized membrane protein